MLLHLKLKQNQYLRLDLPSTNSFSSSITNSAQNIVLLDTGVFIINNQEFNISKIDEIIIAIKATFVNSEVVILSIENKAYHEWVISLMDALQDAGFQNIQIKTYTN